MRESHEVPTFVQMVKIGAAGFSRLAQVEATPSRRCLFLVGDDMFVFMLCPPPRRCDIVCVHVYVPPRSKNGLA